MARLVFLCVLALIHVSLAAELKEEFVWNFVDYAWPSADFKVNAFKTGAFVPENNLPLGLALWNDKLFVSVPRWKSGVASSLNYVKIGSDKSSPLIPYPSWEANYIPVSDESVPKAVESGVSLKDNSTIVSVFRMSIDKCDRMWVMDTGLADILGTPKVMSKPSLVIFDLKTDTLVRRYFFKDSDLKESSFLANVIVESNENSCDDAFAYVPDLGAGGIIVYSMKENDSWRVNHHYFKFDPLAGQFKIGGITVEWSDGVFSVAPAKIQSDGFRPVYFHAFASTKEFEVSNRILQNKTLANSPESNYDFKLLGERGPNTQASSSFYDEKSDVLFYTQPNLDGVACWNPNKPLTPENSVLIARDPIKLEFPIDLKVAGDHVWIIANRMTKFIFKGLDKNEINFRIFTIPVQEAIVGTACA